MSYDEEEAWGEIQNGEHGDNPHVPRTTRQSPYGRMMEAELTRRKELKREQEQSRKRKKSYKPRGSDQ